MGKWRPVCARLLFTIILRNRGNGFYREAVCLRRTEGLASIDKDTRGFDGQKNVHTSSKTLEIHRVFPADFSSSDRFSASAKLLAPDSDGFSSDFCFLRRRCVVTHQGEKARPFSRTPSKAQRSGFARKKEEGESIMEFSPQGGNGMARTSSDVNRRTQA